MKHLWHSEQPGPQLTDDGLEDTRTTVTVKGLVLSLGLFSDVSSVKVAFDLRIFQSCFLASVPLFGQEMDSVGNSKRGE